MDVVSGFYTTNLLLSGFDSKSLTSGCRLSFWPAAPPPAGMRNASPLTDVESPSLPTRSFVLLTAARIGTDALRINPLRTALSTLGMIIGVAALVAVLSLGDGMERTAREQLQSTSPIQALGVSSRMVDLVDGDAFPRRDTLPLTRETWRALGALPGVASAAIMTQLRIEARLDTVRRLATLRGALGGDR